MTAKEGKQRIGVSAVSAVLIVLFRILEPSSELKDVLGMLLAVAAVSAVLFRFPFPVYLLCMMQVLLAAAGSILLLYDKLPGYDRVVHYISGIVLGCVGYTAMTYLLELRKLPRDPAVLIVTAFLFAGMCAGFWEIIEFTMDQLFALDVQHGNTDTMGDIVAGFLGGITYCGVLAVKAVQERKKTGSCRKEG